MANNTNAQAVSFANQYARPMFDELYSCYLTMEKFLELWSGGNYASVIPNDSNLLDDGSLQGGTYPGSPDGRLSVTDADIQILQANVTTLKAVFNANSNLVLNQVLQGNVNGASRI